MNKRIAMVLTAITLLTGNILKAQTVSTVLTGGGLDGPDGFAINQADELFVANWGGGYGTDVIKINSNGNSSVMFTGFSAPDGLVFDQTGNLYISNYASGIINKITPDGIKTDFASGLNHPSALAFDNSGNLNVSNHGSTEVSRITPDGTVSVFANGFHAPLGLVFDTEGFLYVSNYSTGVINKVTPDGTVSIFAQVTNSPQAKLQYLVFDQNHNLYVPSYGHHKIYRVNSNGVVSVYAGTGTAGSTDGAALEAKFNGPNSIAINSSGEIYVSEYNANRIRKITPETGITECSGQPSEITLSGFPNPFNNQTRISYHLENEGRVEIIIYNSLGVELQTVVNQYQKPGSYSCDFKADGLPGGVYYCKVLFNGNQTGNYRLVLLK